MYLQIVFVSKFTAWISIKPVPQEVGSRIVRDWSITINYSFQKLHYDWLLFLTIYDTYDTTYNLLWTPSLAQFDIIARRVWRTELE